MPDTVIPMASDEFGNQYCLGVTEEEYGKIYYWNHEERDPRDFQDKGLPVPDDIWWQKMTPVADSFHVFVSQIVVEPW